MLAAADCQESLLHWLEVVGLDSTRDIRLLLKVKVTSHTLLLLPFPSSLYPPLAPHVLLYDLFISPPKTSPPPLPILSSFLPCPSVILTASLASPWHKPRSHPALYPKTCHRLPQWLCLVVLTPIITKCLEKLVLRHIITCLSPTFDTHQFAICANRSAEDTHGAPHCPESPGTSREICKDVFHWLYSSAFNMISTDVLKSSWLDNSCAFRRAKTFAKDLSHHGVLLFDMLPLVGTTSTLVFFFFLIA